MVKMKLKNGTLQLGLHNQQLIALKFKDPSKATIKEVLTYLQLHTQALIL